MRETGSKVSSTGHQSIPNGRNESLELLDESTLVEGEIAPIGIRALADQRQRFHPGRRIRQSRCKNGMESLHQRRRIVGKSGDDNCKRGQQKQNCGDCHKRCRQGIPASENMPQPRIHRPGGKRQDHREHQCRYERKQHQEAAGHQHGERSQAHHLVGLAEISHGVY